MPLSEFAHSTRLGGSVVLLKGRKALQRDLDRLKSVDWGNCMTLSEMKYQILHMG